MHTGHWTLSTTFSLVSVALLDTELQQHLSSPFTLTTTMADQMLEKARDLAEGQIVRSQKFRTGMLIVC